MRQGISESLRNGTIVRRSSSSSSGSQSQRTQRTDALARAMYRASASDDPETIKMIRDGFGVCGSIKQLQGEHQHGRRGGLPMLLWLTSRIG